MSIRLRLTLLYSAILAVTLIVFSTTLYVAQAQITLGDIKTSLTRQANAFVNAPRHSPGGPGEPPPNGTLPGRWTQICNLDGTVTARTGDLSDTTLPLSEAGLHAVQNGRDWFETVQVQAQPLLIYSLPVITQGQVTQVVKVAAPLAEREQSLNTLRLILTTGSGLVLLIAFAIGWVLAGTALAPIDRITHTAQAIGAERNFSHRVEHVGPNDEVGQLAITFNTMLTELESAYRQLQQVLESQRRFVADASHELRTPLTTVRGNIELLGHEPPMDTQEQADVLTDTKDEVERLIRLVTQLLGLARADAGRALRQEPLPIKPVLEDVCRQAKLLSPARTFICEAALDVTVVGDHDALKQILLILLDNAFAHTPPSATISMTSAAADGRVAISVHDTGPGIAPHLLPHIFERFYRGEVSRSGTGSGLGLSIAKELVEAQNGVLTVESRVGQGSVFTVTLPQAK
jgi:two-component system OmpR family sensor kinase